MKRKLKKFLDLFKNWDETSANLNWMRHQIRGYEKFIFVVLLISIVSLLFSLASTVIGKYVVDAATNAALLPKYVFFMVGSTVFSILISSGTKLATDYINEKFSFGMRCRVFDNIQRSLWKELSKFHSGDIVTRLTSDISSLSGSLISILPSTIVVMLQLIFAFFILFHYDRPIAIFALILGPIGAGSAIVFKNKYKKYQTLLRESESEYRSFMQETMSNITVTKTFQSEDENYALMQKMREDRLKIVMKSSKLSALMGAVMRAVYSVGYVIAFCWGAYRLSKGEITYGTMTIFISLVSQIQGSVGSLARIIPQFYSMLISTKRIREIADIPNEEYSENKEYPDDIGLKIDGVSFTYEKETILKNVDFTVAPGEKIGIVGSSGAGKTTLIRLLLSLVKPDDGNVCYTLNGIDEPAAPCSRRFISYVPQGNTLLSGSVAKNLKTGKSDATSEEMWKALQMAGAADFLVKSPKGLGTVLSENAGGISEGQAQRIAIARALLRNKPVLILDEATSALDESTESVVLGRISEGCSKTCFIITHRRSMLKYCDRVIEISDEGDVSVRAVTQADGIEE